MKVNSNNFQETLLSNKEGYTQIQSEQAIAHKGILTNTKKIERSRKLTLGSRTRIIALAILGSLLIFPLLICPRKIITYWKRGINGSDILVTFVKPTPINPDNKAKQVKIGEARCRKYDQDDAPTAVNDIKSTIFIKII